LDAQNLDYIVTKIESLAMDEQSRNLMSKKEMEQYIFKGENQDNKLMHLYLQMLTKLMNIFKEIISLQVLLKPLI